MIKKQFLLVFISIFLISCLEVDSSIDIKKDGTGIWNLQYKISQEALYVTPGLEFSGFNYFPKNENEIKKRISETAGLELLRVSVSETAGYSEYSARMSFKNTDNIESFFIYTGFALYFGLHILASNTVSLNFRQYWFFAQYATLISLIYWTGSVFFIWKIKSKHLF